jgi:AcrR family transcriptional regulator
VSVGPASPGGEESTRERIRNAAIARFGRDGFGVGLRTIAADAGVTAGLVVQRFGSKDGLRRACDEYALQVLREEKTKAVLDGSPSTVWMQMARIDDYAPIARYLLRCLQEGGATATALINDVIADAEQYLAAGEAAGVIRPSRDPTARARLLAYQSMGALLLWFSLHGSTATDDDQFRILFRRYVEEVTPPALELLAQGLLVNRSMLDEFLLYVPDPPGDPGAADPH